MKRIVVLGAGGLGCAIGWALLQARPLAEIVWVDPDIIEESNLARQVLFGEADLGAPKAERAAAVLRARGLASRALVERFDARSAHRLLDDADLVIEGTDSYPSKFLAADAAMQARVPIAHAGIVGWSGWALAALPGRSACLRCVFERAPEAGGATCTAVGVIGAAVGTLGALQTTLALRLLEEHTGAFLRFDGLTCTLRRSQLGPRDDCPLCGAVAGERESRHRFATDPTFGPPHPLDIEESFMTVKVRIPTPLRTLTQGKDEVMAEGDDVRAAIANLDEHFPGLRDRLCDEKGVRRFVNIFLNEDDIRFLDNLDTTLKAGDTLQIVPAIAGGAG